MSVPEISLKSIGLATLLILVLSCSCAKEDNPLEPNVVLSGKVTNSSGASGTIIVEIEYYIRDTADSQGYYALKVHADFFVDSLYAWVDKDGNGKYTKGEPFGFYHSQHDSVHANSFHVRNNDISGLDIDIRQR
jgi:hypothetical protein